MGPKADNHIRVTDETWTRLNARKGPGDSFEDVIVELLDRTESSEEGDADEGNPRAVAATGD